ncbi:MAG TPA: pyridoxal phosphate-dependent aminotransferase [Candidatus Omnitrophota bacterium]|nr:pyridoxal phosphate-dependent aminotransferase [Candidatus Omnitrophota bacterium]
MMVNRRVAGLVESSTLAITARAKELSSQGHDVVNFGAGEPDFDTPEIIKQAGIQAIQKGFTKYTPSIGTLSLRQEIAKKFSRDNKLEYKPSQIVVSCGAKHSIYSIIQVLADDGDEVLIPAPYWVSYPEMVKLAGAVPVYIATTPETGLKVTPAALKKSITKKTRIFIFNSPSNPTGVVYTKEEIRALAEICVANDIWILSDEIYEKLIYDIPEYTSVASLSKQIYDKTITVNGVSKAYSMTGWRIGYAAGPQEIMDHMKRFQDHSTSNPTSISQAASEAAFKMPEADIQAMVREFKARRDLITSLVDKIPEISYVYPQGAFYLFCDISKLGDSEAVAKVILDDVKVALIPGDGFGAPGFARLSFATSTERIQEGIKRIAQWISKSK